MEQKAEILEAWRKAAKYLGITILSDMTHPAEDRPEGRLIAKTRQLPDNDYYVNFRKELFWVQPRFIAMHSLGEYMERDLVTQMHIRRVWVRFGYIL